MPGADFSAYQEHVKELRRAAKDFWFIYNQPTPVDIDASEARKKWMKIEGVTPPDSAVYYTDPIQSMERIIAHEKREQST